MSSDTAPPGWRRDRATVNPGDQSYFTIHTTGNYQSCRIESGGGRRSVVIGKHRDGEDVAFVSFVVVLHDAFANVPDLKVTSTITDYHSMCKTSGERVLVRTDEFDTP